MPEIAITGSSGHLGYVIHKMLQRDGISHRLLLRKQFDYIDHAEVVKGALEEDAARARFVEGCKVVIHCAGKVWPKTGPNQSVLNVNFEMTKRLYNDAVRLGVEHFIFISSIHSMVVPVGGVFDESASLVHSPRNPYDYSKAEAERFLNSRQDIGISILNPTAMIGTGDHYIRGLNQLFDRLHRHKLPAVTAGGFDVVDVRDVANAALSASRLRKHGKYIISGKYYTMADLTRLYGMINHTKVPDRIIGPGLMRFLAIASMPVDRIKSKPLPLNTYSVNTLLDGHPGISSAAAERDLQFSSRAIEQTLRDLQGWFTNRDFKF